MNVYIELIKEKQIVIINEKDYQENLANYSVAYDM